MVVDSSISLCRSIKFPLMYFELLLLGTYKIKTVVFLEYGIHYYYITPVFIPDSFPWSEDCSFQVHFQVMMPKPQLLCPGAQSNLRDTVLGEVETNSFTALPVKGWYSGLLPLKSMGHHLRRFDCGSAGKESTCSREFWVQSLSWEDPLEKEKATHSSILA